MSAPIIRIRLNDLSRLPCSLEMFECPAIRACEEGE